MRIRTVLAIAFVLALVGSTLGIDIYNRFLKLEPPHVRNQEWEVKPVNRFEILSSDELAIGLEHEFDPRLVAKLKEKGGLIREAYHFDEGVAFSASSGSYAVYDTADGNVLWLVKAGLDSSMRVGILDALAYIPRHEWERAVAEANKQGLKRPSARTLIPSRYMQVKGEEVSYRGEHF